MPLALGELPYEVDTLARRHAHRLVIVLRFFTKPILSQRDV